MAMAHITMACIVLADLGTKTRVFDVGLVGFVFVCIVWSAWLTVRYIVMAYIVMAYIVMDYVIMDYIVMAV